MGLSWQRVFSSRPFFFFGIGDWVVGAAGFDQKLLGWFMHPLVAMTLVGIGSAFIFLHLQNRYQSGALFGENPIKLGLRFVKRKKPDFHPATPTPPKAIKITSPPTITPRGGEDFSLELRSNYTAIYYGFGWLKGKGVTRRKKFDLSLGRRIRKGDVAAIPIADYPDGLNVHGIAEIVHSSDEFPRDWLRIHIEIRAKNSDKTWKYCYRFKLDESNNEFKVEAYDPDSWFGFKKR